MSVAIPTEQTRIRCSHAIRKILSDLGYELPVVCTPEEMIDDPNHGNLDFE